MLILCVEKECLVSFGSKLTFILSIEYPFGNIRTQSFENNNMVYIKVNQMFILVCGIQHIKWRL